MFVCHCRAVSDCTIRDMIAAGATSLCALAETCGAGSRCGGCHVALRQMLAEAGLDLPARASAPARATAA